MFFADADAAHRNIAGALKPGGRVALQSWQPLDKNPWLVALRTALAAGRDLPAPPNGTPGPFGLADPDQVRALLGGAGFDTIEFTSVEVPMFLGHDPDDAWAFTETMGIVRGLTGGLDDAAKSAALGELRAVVERHHTDGGVLLDAASWIITATRSS
jgi:hypothetical protein